MTTTELIEHGCPVCGSLVKGSDEGGFYCRTCNLLFKREHLNRHTDKSLPVQLVQTAPKEMPAMSDIPLSEARFVASRHSDKFHRIGCRYIDQIRGGHFTYFRNAADASVQGFKPCSCARAKPSPAAGSPKPGPKTKVL